MKKIILNLYFKIRSHTLRRNDTNLHYILECSKKEDPLVVIFSAFPRNGMEATYNYLRTLKDIKANKLFILDRFGYKKRGCYYLGEGGKFNVEPVVLELIEKVKKECDATKIICLGSSKGGYAALYFGHLICADYLIIGAPQYFLGNYLTDNRIKIPILKGIAGDHSELVVEKLNSKLPDIIRSSSNPRRIYLHYSNKEHTYLEHITDLIIDFKKKEQSVVVDQQGYRRHQEVRNYFPHFLLKSIKEILEE